MIRSLLTLIAIVVVASEAAGAADYVPRDYVWTSQSSDSSGSMPCGGHDVGLNVWVEKGDLMFYAAQSGWFDENNTLLKAGRWRLHIEGDPFADERFEQRLCLDDGAVYIKGRGIDIALWVDTEEPVAYLTVKARKAKATTAVAKPGGDTPTATLSYESWRYRDRAVTRAECQQCSYKWVLPPDCTTFADSISATNGHLAVTHLNREHTVFDFTVEREQLTTLRDSLYNPLARRCMTVDMRAPDFAYTGTTHGTYASTDFLSYNFVARHLRQATVTIRLANSQQPMTPPEQELAASRSRSRSARWWHSFWQRSWIVVNGNSPVAARMVRNYELMRYMLGCNARGEWPTKFNGGLFTFDPVYADSSAAFTPDYRKWGGGTMTAQNQRLLHWPMLKSGDTDLLRPQIDTYLRLLPTAEAWTRHHWHHQGACFSEQMENFGLPNPAEYGKHPQGSDRGVERNAWLEYEWDTALEFCQMALLATRHTVPDGFAVGSASRPYRLLAESCLRFFDEHYQYLARQRGAKTLDDSGHLVIFPGSACETFKMAYNPASTIAALHALTATLADSSLARRLPPVPLRVVEGDTCIAPAQAWARVQNVETPQLYPVFPWRLFGLGRPGLATARNTYLKDPHALAMRSAKGWKQDNIWAACLGLTSEASRLNAEKLADGPYRFPAFWPPGFDWAPDMNRGGAGMIGLQEMLLQEQPDGQPLLFPAWPKDWNASFRLHTTDGRVVEATIDNGHITTL